MNKENISQEIEMCENLLKKFQGSLDDCKKDYEFLKEQKEEYGETEEHQKAVEVLQERTEGVKITMGLLSKRLETLKEKKSKVK